MQRPFRDAVPAEVRGQAFGLMSTGLMTLQGVGPTVFGLATEVVPVGTAMAFGGVATVLTAIWVGATGSLSGRTGRTIVPRKAKTPVLTHRESAVR